jgi:hypothetical protein
MSPKGLSIDVSSTLASISTLYSSITAFGMPVAFLDGGWQFPSMERAASTLRLNRDAGRGDAAQTGATMKPLSIHDWYRILRAQYHWTILWLARQLVSLNVCRSGEGGSDR